MHAVRHWPSIACKSQRSRDSSSLAWCHDAAFLTMARSPIVLVLETSMACARHSPKWSPTGVCSPAEETHARQCACSLRMDAPAQQAPCQRGRRGQCCPPHVLLYLPGQAAEKAGTPGMCLWPQAPQIHKVLLPTSILVCSEQCGYHPQGAVHHSVTSLMSLGALVLAAVTSMMGSSCPLISAAQLQLAGADSVTQALCLQEPCRDSWVLSDAQTAFDSHQQRQVVSSPAR